MTIIFSKKAAARTMCLLPLLISHSALSQELPPEGDALDYFFNQMEGETLPARSSASDHGRESPLQLWSGDNGSFLRATLKAEMAYFAQDNSWFGEARENLGEASNSWWETAITPGLNGSYFLGNGSEFFGVLNSVSTSTKDIDAAGSNVGYGDTSDTWVNEAYLGWRSGTLFNELGKDFLSLSFGRQQYVAGTGFLFYSQGSNGGKRGGFWLGDRKAADLSGLVTIKYGNLQTDLVYMEADDQDSDNDPNNNTKVGGVTLDYSLGDLGGIGGGYYSVSAEAKPRDGMDILDVRFSLTPFKKFMPGSALESFTFDGEYVDEDNGDALQASAWYLSGEYSWDDASWQPSLTYRYSTFDGDNPNSEKSENFDPLFYGFYDWGYWFQGEILGEYMLSNSNLNASMIRLSADPTSSIHVNLFYYDFELDNAAGFGVQSDKFGDEWDITVDWSATDFLSFSLVGGYVTPDDGAKEYTGGNDDWAYFMLYTSFSFK